MGPLLSTILSIIFLLLGAVAVYTMMSVQGARAVSDPKLYLGIHRILGWIFVALFVVIFVFMLQRVGNYWEEPSPRINIHMTLSIFLFSLLLVKIMIPRFFPKLSKNLFFLGIGVYLTSFTLVSLTAGYYITRKLERVPYISHAGLVPGMLDERLGKELFIEKCSTCHMLQRIMQLRSAEAWEKVVNNMISLAEPRITLDEGGQILHYLALTHLPKPFEGPAEASLVDKHCLPCHDITEIFGKQYNRTSWTEIIKQMTQYDPEIVPTEMIDEIVDFLLENQQNE